MTTLQEYLTSQYSLKEAKEKLTKISILEINHARSEQAITDLLTGGELDLCDYPNIEQVIIDNQLLQTPLTKIDTTGLIHLKEISWNPEPVKLIDSEEDKKLWAELGLSAEDNEKKQVIRELTRISELFSSTYASNQKITVQLVTDQVNSDKLTTDQNGLAVKDDEQWTIYLRLNQTNEQLFYTLAQELTHTLIETRFSPHFWQRFLLDQDNILQWVNEQAKIKLVNEQLFFFTEQHPSDIQQEQATCSESIIPTTYQTISEELINLTNEELSKGVDKEKLWLAISKENTSLQVSYHRENPLQEQIKQLIKITPLQIELTSLRKQQALLPTTENFAKLSQQKQELANYLHNYTDEETYQSIIAKLNQINNYANNI